MPERPSSGLRTTWPVQRRQAWYLIAGWAVLTALWIGIGKLLTGPLKSSSITRTDQRIANWMVSHRTPTWNHLTVLGSDLAETVTKVVVTATLALILLIVWKRWLEPLVLVISLVIEAAAFIAVTTIVNRSRPAVPRLDDSPVGSSFPSGHVAAAVAYTAIAVVVFWHTRKLWARAIAAIVAGVIPVVVALSRMYRGMHFLSDVVGGALLGAAAVVLTVAALRTSLQAGQIHRSPIGVPSTTDETSTAPNVADSHDRAVDLTAPTSASNLVAPAMPTTSAADADSG